MLKGFKDAHSLKQILIIFNNMKLMMMIMNIFKALKMIISVFLIMNIFKCEVKNGLIKE